MEQLRDSGNDQPGIDRIPAVDYLPEPLIRQPASDWLSPDISGGLEPGGEHCTQAPADEGVERWPGVVPGGQELGLVMVVSGLGGAQGGQALGGE